MELVSYSWSPKRWARSTRGTVAGCFLMNLMHSPCKLSMQYSSHQRISNSTLSSETFRSRPTPGWRNSSRTWNSAGFLPGNTIRRFFFSFISCVSILWKTGDANIRTAECVLISVAASSSNLTVMSCGRNKRGDVSEVLLGGASLHKWVLPATHTGNFHEFPLSSMGFDGLSPSGMHIQAGIQLVCIHGFFLRFFMVPPAMLNPVLHECAGAQAGTQVFWALQMLTQDGAIIKQHLFRHYPQIWCSIMIMTHDSWPSPSPSSSSSSSSSSLCKLPFSGDKPHFQTPISRSPWHPQRDQLSGMLHTYLWKYGGFSMFGCAMLRRYSDVFFFGPLLFQVSFKTQRPVTFPRLFGRKGTARGPVASPVGPFIKTQTFWTSERIAIAVLEGASPTAPETIHSNHVNLCILYLWLDTYVPYIYIHSIYICNYVCQGQQRIIAVNI